jgi:hypothetical protein
MRMPKVDYLFGDWMDLAYGNWDSLFHGSPQYQLLPPFNKSSGVVPEWEIVADDKWYDIFSPGSPPWLQVDVERRCPRGNWEHIVEVKGFNTGKFVGLPLLHVNSIAWIVAWQEVLSRKS